MDTLAILDVEALMNVHQVAKLHPKVVTSHLVHLNASFFNIIGAQANKDSVASLFAAVAILSFQRDSEREYKLYLPNNNGVASE